MNIQDFFTRYTIIEILCLFTALFCLPHDQSKSWKYFPIYLFITCATELFAIYLRKHHHNNQWPYNISIVFEASFISSMFLTLFNKYFNSKPLILSGLALLLIIYGFEVRAHNFTLFTNITHDTLNEKTNEAMSVLFSIYSFLYFFLLINDERYIDIKYSAEIWWVVGVLFFYFGTTTLNLFRGVFHADYPNMIMEILIWILYGLWSYSFICRKWLITKSRN